VLIDGERIEVLELNPRPPASLALYPHLGEVGVLSAHLRACEEGVLPAPSNADTPVRGIEILFAGQRIEVDAAHAQALAALPGTCDLPRAGTRVAAGDPLCSVRAEGGDEARMNEQLAVRREAVRALFGDPR
jgi:predicted ATP-grasp superfamily ATP-dependent carboligase